MPIEEPRVKVTTVDLSTLPTPVPDSLNLGMVIDSDDGPVKITRVDSQPEFVKNYLSGNQLNPTDSDTVKHAYALLQFMPIYVTRAMDNSVLGGITNNGDTIFTDLDFQVQKYYKKLEFHETEANYNSVCMKLKANGAKDASATLFYMGGNPDYVTQLEVESSYSSYTATAKLPAKKDYIFDIITEKYYRIISEVSGAGAIASVEDVTSVGTDGSYFKYAFNVNFHKKFTVPTVDQLYKLGSIACNDGGDYFTVSAISGSTLTLNKAIKLVSTSTNLLNLIIAFNNHDVASEGDNYSFSRFLTVDNTSEQLIVTIPNNTVLSYLGYRTANSGEYTSVEVESTLESSKYKQFTGSATSVIDASNYLSIEGYTYFSNASSSSNNLYPFINVNFGINNISVCKFFTYIYDYQLSSDANVVPTSLQTSITVQLPEGYTFEAYGDFVGKYIVSTDGSEITLLNNAKVTMGYVVIKGGVKDIVFYVGYDASPVYGATVADSMFDDEGNVTIHTSGKLLYAINDQITNCTLTEGPGDARLMYLSQSIQSVENSATASITGPTIAGSNFRYSFSSDEVILGNKTYSGLQLIIDDYLFYNVSYSTKNPDLTPVRLSSAPLTYMQFIRHLRRIVGNYFNSINSDNGLTLMTNDPDEYSVIEFSGSGISMDEVVSTNNAGIVTSAKFAVINKCPSKKKNLMFSITQDADDPELWTLVITRKTDETSYTISFVEDKVDGYGRNVYYTYVNELNPYIQLVELDGDDPVINGTYTSELFGNEVPIADPESDDFVNAVNRFKENEGIYYDFIFDGGYANMVYAKGIFEVCKEIYAEGLLTMPQITDPSQLIQYRENCGIDTFEGWRCVMRGNWINNTSVADFLIRMSPMCAYVEKIVNNKTGMNEFAPIFGPTNSSITYEPGFYIKKKSVREDMLGHQIPVIIEDKSLNLRYWNLDTTLKVVDSSLCDANNCRMINVGAHICDNQMKWYIGQFNTPATRSNVTSSLTQLLTDRLIKNQLYALAGLRVICNESNNPVSVVEAREIVVDVAYQFTPGIRYVNVFQKVYKLSQDLNEL